MRLYPSISLLFGIWILSLFVIAYLGYSSFPHSPRFNNDFIMSLANWDGGHYLGIAEYGYSESFQFAFFPLYPLLIRALNFLTQDYLVAALLLSITSFFFSLNLLYRLAAEYFDKKVAQKTILYIFFFPTSFYFLTAYSEGLFFFFVVLTFYFIKKGKYFWATAFAALASSTRVAGLAVSFALIVDVLVRQGINRKNWYVVFAPLGFIIYSLYLFIQTSDPFYFITAQTYWLRSISHPAVGFWETIKNISFEGIRIGKFNAFLDLLFAVFGLGMIIRSFRFLPPYFGVYGLVSILLPLLTPTLTSMPRFLLPIFPIFILLALVKNQYVIFAYQLVTLMLLGLFVTLFVNGYWVA